ncbi:unnamed protein product [Blepharisma stoltei]|uniref:Uncharacterized protein n=1 Tax=Blepharisma stoltei TaxID=1481888 RepID=A0AAU9K6R1_9CILI|nr:unnamed protein product [Blepharisma stoltei]
MSICSYIGCRIPVIYACFCDTNELYFCSNHLKNHIQSYPAINHRYLQAFIDAQSEIRKRTKILFNSASKELDKAKNNALQNAAKKINDINRWVYEYLGNIHSLENDLLASIRRFFLNEFVLEDDFEKLEAKTISYLDQIKSWASLDDLLNSQNKIISKQHELEELRLSLAFEKSKTVKLEKDLNEVINKYEAAMSENKLMIQEILQSGYDSSRTMNKHFIENENKMEQLEKAVKHIKDKKNRKKFQLEALMQANLFLARFLESPQNPNFIQKMLFTKEREKYNPYASCISNNCDWPGGDLIEHLKANHNCEEFLMVKNGIIRYWHVKVWKNCQWDIWILKLASGVPIIMKSFCDDKAFYVQFYDLEAKRIKLKLNFANSGAKMQYSLRTESLEFWNEEYREMPFCLNLNILEKHMLVISEEFEGCKKLCILIQAKS